MKWTQKNLSRARKVLCDQEPGTSLAAAAEAVSGKLKERITTDALRKAFSAAGMKSPVEYIPKPEYVPQMVEAAQKRDETARLRQQVDDLVRQVREANERQGFIDSMQGHHPEPIIKLPKDYKKHQRVMTAVVAASDWHVEETVEAESVSFRNEYNLKIAARRIDRYFEAIIWDVLHNRASGFVRIEDLLLWLGGDLITGYIHDELVETNAMSPIMTVLWLMPRLADWIRALLDQLGLKRIVVVCSYGNHGRTTVKRRVSSGHANSYEWMMYNQLAQQFKDDPRVQFEITASGHQYAKVYDTTIHFHHGDDVRYQGGVGGLGIPLLKKVPQWDLVRKADVHVIGHHHSLRDYGRAVVNGSLIGYNAYAQSIGAEFEEPQQLMFYVDSERGKCLTRALWVADKPK